MRVRHDMVACYVVRPDGSGKSHDFLQLRRAAGDYMGGTWQTVYGTTRDDAEPLWQAAIRELREETCLVPKDFFRLATVRGFYVPEQDTVWHYTSFCAIVDRSAIIQLNDEHDASRWVPRRRVADEFLWATDRSAIEELCRDILDDGPAKPYLRISLDDAP